MYLGSNVLPNFLNLFFNLIVFRKSLCFALNGCSALFLSHTGLFVQHFFLCGNCLGLKPFHPEQRFQGQNIV